MRAMPKQERAFWTQQAETIEATDNPLSVPYHVALEEAAGAARFLETHWEPTAERPGMKATGGRLALGVAGEIRALIGVIQQVQTELLLQVDPAVADHGERARFVVDELESAIDFTLDDGVDEPADQKLAQLNKFHSQDGQRSSALVQALLDYSALASELKDRIVEADKDFDPALIDEARKLAAALGKEQGKATGGEQSGATRVLRNRLLALLVSRVAQVRKAAGRVYRGHPEVLRKVTSAHERRRRAEARRAKTEPSPA